MMSSHLKFTITTCRFGVAGISDVEGRVGLWPFRRPVSFHVGVNCDAITAADDGVRVLRRGALIACSRYAPLAFRKLQVTKLDWEQLLTPRHTRRTSPSARGLQK
jgi:hypothetical protein